MSVNPDEINFLIARHLQESGFTHTSYVFSNESLLDELPYTSEMLPPRSLLTIIQKGMLYMQLEKGINEKVKLSASPEDVITSIIDEVHQQEPVVAPKPLPKPRPLPKQVHTVDIPFDSVLVLNKHSGEVNSCAWSKDSKYLATGSSDGTAIITKFDGERPIGFNVLSHTHNHDQTKKEVQCLAWSNSGELLATGCSDGSIRIWTNNGVLKFVLSNHTNHVVALQFSPDDMFLVSCPWQGQILLWSVNTGQRMQAYGDDKMRTLDIEWYQNRKFATTYDSTKIALCDITSPKPELVLNGHTQAINKLAWDPTKTFLASCSDDATICIWRPSESNIPSILDQHNAAVYTIKWMPSTSQKILASCAFDYTVKLWDAVKLTCLHDINIHTNKLYTIAFSPRGKYIASGGNDRVLNIFRTSDASHVASYKTTATIFEASWSDNGKMIAVSETDASVAVVSTSLIPSYQD